MTPSERKAANEYDGIAVIRPCGCSVCSQCGAVTAKQCEAFEAMREALTHWAHSAEDIHRNGKLYTAAEVHRAVMQARAALALAEGVGK